MELCAKEKKCNRGRERVRTEGEARFKIWRSGKASRFSREFSTHTGLKQASRRAGPWRGHLRTATHWMDGVVLDVGEKHPSHGPIGVSPLVLVRT